MKFTCVAHGFLVCGWSSKYKGVYTAHHLAIRRTMKFNFCFRQTHGVSIIVTNGLTLFMELIAVYSEHHMEHSVSAKFRVPLMLKNNC